MVDKDWDQEYKDGAHWETGVSDLVVEFEDKYITKGSKTLDIGCGSGRDCIFLHSKDHDVYGIDISKEAIKKAKSKSKKIDFQVAQAEKLPFADNFFDFLYSGYVFQRTKLQDSISEASRVLKPDGIFYLVMFLEINYEDHNKYDLKISKSKLLEILEKYFEILDSKYDKYSESDQHGLHYHSRAKFTLKNITAIS